MFYHDLLKKELFDYINSEYSKKISKRFQTNHLLISNFQVIKNMVTFLQILQWYLLRKSDFHQETWL